MNKERLEEFKKKIENIDITYDYYETYTQLINTTIDYMNETQDWDFDYLFEDFLDYEIAEEQAKYELENGGLARLYYFLGNANCNNDLFKIDGYGNLQDIYKDDLDYLKEQIIEMINDKIEKERKNKYE